jgi:uncharacterized protein involved in exopolysaccharide biosynthesis
VPKTASNPEHDFVLQPEFDTPVNGEVYEKEAQERTLARMRLLWHQRRFLFRITAVGLLLSTAMAWLVPSRFTSTTRLMPPDQQGGSAMAIMAAMSGKLGSLGGLAGDLAGIKTPGDLFIGVMASRTVQATLVKDFDLQKVYGQRYLEDAINKLGERTAISEDRKSGIITIQVTDRDPQRAAAMAQEYVTQLNGLMNVLTTSSAHRERLFLEERLTQVKQELDAAENDFSQFASKNAAINIPEQGKAMVQAAATLQGQLIGAESELEGLRQIYTSNNVRVRSLEARVTELRHELDKLGGDYGSAAESGVNAMYPSMRELPILGVTYADLYRKTKIEEVVFESLTQEYELAKVEEAKEIPVVKVLDPADVPHRKSYPPRVLIIALGGILVFTAAVIRVFGGSAWRAIDPDDPRKTFLQEILASVEARVPAFVRSDSRLGAFHRSFWAWAHGNQNGAGKQE